MNMQTAVSPQWLNVGRESVQDVRACFVVGLLVCLLVLSFLMVIRVRLIPVFVEGLCC